LPAPRHSYDVLVEQEDSDEDEHELEVSNDVASRYSMLKSEIII